MFEEPVPRTEMLRVRMTSAEREALRDLAERHGMSESALIRWLIKRELAPPQPNKEAEEAVERLRRRRKG